MNSEQISLMASSPLVKEIVFKVIRSIKNKKIVQEERFTIHTDLVPRVSERVMMASLKENRVLQLNLPEIKKISNPQPQPIQPKPIQPQPFIQQTIKNINPPTPRTPIPQRMNSQVNMPVAQQISQTPSAPINGYGKIEPLLNDPSISIIECPGPKKPIVIIRSGRRQFTKISLSSGEIKKFLEKISEAVHIPLLEGVFRARVGNLSISAIISEIIGSKFVIKKQTPYAMPGRGF